MDSLGLSSSARFGLITPSARFAHTCARNCTTRQIFHSWRTLRIACGVSKSADAGQPYVTDDFTKSVSCEPGVADTCFRRRLRETRASSPPHSVRRPGAAVAGRRLAFAFGFGRLPRSDHQATRELKSACRSHHLSRVLHRAHRLPRAARPPFRSSIRPTPLLSPELICDVACWSLLLHCLACCPLLSCWRIRGAATRIPNALLSRQRQSPLRGKVSPTRAATLRTSSASSTPWVRSSTTTSGRSSRRPTACGACTATAPFRRTVASCRAAVSKRTRAWALAVKACAGS